MNDFQPNPVFCNRDNIALLLMCRRIIENDTELSGCIVRQQGAVDATLGAYLDFWYNSLPMSIDNQCNPICAVTSDGCFIASDCSGETVVEQAKLNVPLKDVVDAFKKCQQAYLNTDSSLSINEVIATLMNIIAEGKISPEMLCGGQVFHQAAERSILNL